MHTTGATLTGQLSRSQIYREYEKAFAAATKLPLILRPPDDWSRAASGHRNENPFCAILAESSKSCAACLRVQEQIGNPDAVKATSATCFAGLCDTAVPVRIGEELAGFLQTGQVALEAPSAARFQKIAKQVLDWGMNVDLRRLEDAYYHSVVLTPQQYSGFVHLLEIFATHLSMIGNQLVIQEEHAESPFIRRAKAYVQEHQADPINLTEVARVLHVSTFYFCKMFKRATGLTFTEYLARVRIERAKTLLLDPNRQVSEVAYEVGFGSLSHFNRVFKQLVGRSPSTYRQSVPHPPKQAHAFSAAQR